MSQAFVRGEPRKTFERSTPPGYVRLYFSGKLSPNGTREFRRPIPYAQASMDTNDPMVVGVDRTCLATVDEADYLLSLGGGFTKYEAPTKPVMPEPEPEVVVIPEEAMDDAEALPEEVEHQPVEMTKPERPRKGGRFVKKGDA